MSSSSLNPEGETMSSLVKATVTLDSWITGNLLGASLDLVYIKSLDSSSCLHCKNKIESIWLLQFHDYPYHANFMNAMLETENSCGGN